MAPIYDSLLSFYGKMVPSRIISLERFVIRNILVFSGEQLDIELNHNYLGISSDSVFWLQSDEILPYFHFIA